MWTELLMIYMKSQCIDIEILIFMDWDILTKYLE